MEHAFFDKNALKSSVEGYTGRSRMIFDESFLELSEKELDEYQRMKGFSFPTNEGMRKITKDPELEKIENDPVLSRLTSTIRTTINGVRSSKEGGLYVGVNAFHHGHLAFLSKSEAIVSVDMNKFVPYGFAFIVGLVGGAKTVDDFGRQVTTLAASPEKLRDFFENTELGKTALVQGDSPQARRARQALLQGILSTMNEFNPMVHGQNIVPPVFCTNQDSYDYFRTLVMQDKVAGASAKLQGKKMIGILSRSLESFSMTLPELNTMYVSSCFDPRFLGPKERNKFLDPLKEKGQTNVQMIESFLNSGWIVYDVD